MASGENLHLVCPYCRASVAESAASADGTVTCPDCHETFRTSAEDAATDPQADVDDAVTFEELSDTEEEAARPFEPMLDPDSEPVVRRIQAIIGESLHLGASRILIMPVKNRVKVVYRIGEGTCPGDDVPPEMLYAVMVRLMTMTNLSGFIKVTAKGTSRNLHVEFRPTRTGLSALVEVARDESVAEACRAKADRLGYRFVDLDQVTIPPHVLAAIAEDVVRDNRALPVSIDGDELTIAVSDPQTPETLERLRFTVDHSISVAMAPEGSILSAIERYYGSSDPETMALMARELARPVAAMPPDARAAIEQLPRPGEVSPDHVAAPVLEHLATMYRDKMFDLFGRVVHSAKLCRKVPESGDLEVVFPQSHVMPSLPADARQYVEQKIWGLREAILVRFEHLLEKNAASRGLAMSYSQYLACCQLADGRPASINPGTAKDAWINFIYALTIKIFPGIQSDGRLLDFTTKQLDDLAAQIHSLLSDPGYVVDPDASRERIAGEERLTTTDEPLDLDSPPIVHLVQLLVAEAQHSRASRLLILPLENQVEVTHRVQTAVFASRRLPLRLLYPVLARLRTLAAPNGELRILIGEKEQDLQVTFHCTRHGLAAVVDLVPDRLSIARCRALAAQQGYDFVDLENIEVAPNLIRGVSKGVAWEKSVLPLSLDGDTLKVALGNPPSRRKLDELRLAFGRQIAVVLAPEDAVLAAIYRHYHPVDAESRPSELSVSMLSRAPRASGATE